MNRINNVNENKTKKFPNEKIKLFLIYTILFSIIVFFLSYEFIHNDKSFIFMSDGAKQHIVTLNYFRSLLLNFFETGKINFFTWSVAAGLDMFSNLAYYVFGDFFSLLSLLSTERYLEYVYDILVIIRMYFIGLCFLAFCRYKKMNVFSSVIGALMYTFCAYVLFASLRHPYFSNAILIFPLIMIGIEKIVNEKKPIFYTFIIFLLFIMNFYFAYMIAIIIAIYGIALTINTYKKDGIKKIIRVLLYVLFYSMIGVAMSAIILLPTGVSFITSERVAYETIYPYTLSYYRNLFDILGLNGHYWVIIGVQSIILITLPIFIKNRKKNYPLFITFIILLFPLFFSKIGSILCGFGFPNNRWSFVISFIFSYMTTWFLNQNTKLKKKDYILIALFTMGYLLLGNIFNIKFELVTQFQLFIAVILLIIISAKDEITKKYKYTYQIVFTGIFVLGIIGTIYYRYDASGTSYLNKFQDFGEYKEYTATLDHKNDNFYKIIENIDSGDKSFYRILQQFDVNSNISLLKGYNSTTVYYSIIPELYTKISKDLCNLSYQINQGIKNFDLRTKINSLLGVKYIISIEGKGKIPYGYRKIDNYGTYINDYYLPFGVLYTKYISEQEYDKLSALEKENSLLKNAALGNYKKEDKSKISNNEIKEIPYKINDSSKILEDNTVNIADSSKKTITIDIGTIENSEVFVYIENLEFDALSKEEKINLTINNNNINNINGESSVWDIRKINFKNKWYIKNEAYSITASLNGVEDKLEVYNRLSSPYYFENKNILFNLGYFDKVSNNIKLNFSNLGKYTFDKIKIYAVSFDDYADDINNLRKSNFIVDDYGDGYMYATANPETDGVLQFSTIYDENWHVYLDGQEVDTFKSNKYFLGINIKSGKHKIELRYKNRYITYGAIVSLIGLILLIITIIFNKNKEYIKCNL